MTRFDPADLASWPGDPVDSAKPSQKLGCNPLTFVFFVFLTKMTPFWIFFKIGIDLADPATQSKPGDQVQTRKPGLGPGRPPGRV